MRSPDPLGEDHARGAPAAAGAIRIPIRSDLDLVAARQRGREMARDLGFSAGELTLIATAISELARNIVVYAGAGEIQLAAIEQAGRRGLVILALDEGPGIRDVKLALQDGYTTSRSLGMGLPGVRRLMDDFEIESELGKGTRVRVRKWLNGRR